MDTAPDPAGTGEAPAAPESAQAQAPPLAKWLVIYSVLRVGLLVVLAAGLSLLMPLILALLFAILLALPLSWLLFGTVREKVTAAMAVSGAQRRGERERLRSALDGQDVDGQGLDGRELNGPELQ